MKVERGNAGSRRVPVGSGVVRKGGVRGRLNQDEVCMQSCWGTSDIVIQVKTCSKKW